MGGARLQRRLGMHQSQSCHPGLGIILSVSGSSAIADKKSISKLSNPAHACAALTDGTVPCVRLQFLVLRVGGHRQPQWGGPSLAVYGCAPLKAVICRVSTVIVAYNPREPAQAVSYQTLLRF